MDEAKEELEAALLQAKQHCVDIQQKVWDHEKQGLRPHEDLYVRRYIYGVTIARKSRFFNGYRPSDVPRSKSLTRIFMEQRYHRSKSTPPLLQKRERSEPKVKIWDSSDGLSTKVEFTETVDESSVRDMIDNDKQECDELGRKLPVDKRNWEHVSDEIAQKGALLRIGEHLYGFDGIRDLSFQAAADVDRFFGRDPSPDLMFASPYHLLKDYLEEYENRFFKNSLSRSAHDLSEWRKRSSETQAAVVGSSISVGDHLEQAPDVQSQTGYNAYRTETNVQNESHSHSSVLQKAIGTVREWRNALEDSVSQRISDRTSRHGSEPAINHSHHTSYSFDYGTPKFQTTAPFECHHHLVRDLEDSASETALLCDVDVQPIAPGLQSEGSIRSMTSSKASTTAGSLPGDHDFSEGIQTPISTYSDAFEHDDATSERSSHFAGDHRGTHLVRHIGDHLIDKVHSTLNVGGHVKSGNETMTITKTMMMDSEENAPRDEDYSDSETLRVQSSVDHSDSEDTIVANNDVDPVGVLRPTAELEESHLSLHVSSVPCQSVWEQKIGSKAEEAESLLRDVHRTHNALQEQIDLYDADIQDIRSSRERIYDTVAADPEHIYDPVADAGLHHARGALVMSQPVQRPLAVTPPSYDATVPAIPAYSSPITDVLHYAEGELGTQQRLYQDDENIYEEIGAPQTAPPKIGQGVTHIPEPEYAVPPSIGEGVTACDKHIKEPEYAVPPAIGEGAVAAAVAEPEYAAPRIGEGAMGITEVSQLHYADTNLNDLNANIDKNHSTIESRIFRKKNDSQRKQTPYQSSDFFHAELIHIDEHGEISTGEHGGKLNRSLGRKHQIIHDIDEERNFSSEKRICPTETFENAKPIPSPTFQKLQHQYTPEDVPHGKAPSPVPPPNSEYDMNKYVDVDVDAAAAAQDKLDRETVLATVEIRRMSRTNQWTEGGSRDFDHGPLSPSSPMLSPKVVISPKKTTGLRSPTAARRSASSERQEIVHSHQYNERSFGKRESQQPHRGIEKSTAIFDEYTFEGLPTTMEFPVTKGKFVRETSPTPKTRHSIGTGAVATTATSIGKGVEKPTPVIGTGAAVGGSVTVVGSGVDLLKRSPELEDIKPMAPTKPAPIGGGVTSTTTTVGSTVASPSTPTFQKGFVHEMARRYEQTHGNETAKTPQRSSSPKIKLSDRQWRSQGTLIGSGVSVVAPTRGTTAKVSVQEKVRILERAATHGELQPDIVHVEESREQKRQRMVSIGTPESINLDEIDLPRRSPSRSNSRAQASAG
ncbi:hypothetical protein Q1695_005212 [Nippostrongylus brasiliensis]|nr:hypothetical protein Q1695_005212 [Nippostrongylus brasiliensis]